MDPLSVGNLKKNLQPEGIVATLPLNVYVVYVKEHVTLINTSQSENNYHVSAANIRIVKATSSVKLLIYRHCVKYLCFSLFLFTPLN